jgi:hypothetical protein
MERTMAKKPEGGVPTTADHIEQIRDIIFGPQKREYDDRFEQLATELQKTRNEASTHIEELREHIEEKITAGFASLDQAIKQLSAKSQADNTSLRKQIEQTEEKLNADIAALSQRVNESNAALRQDLGDTRSKLQADLRGAKEDLTKNIETQSSTLRETKVSRDVMAQMLQEVAMQLRGVEVLEELKKAARK